MKRKKIIVFILIPFFLIFAIFLIYNFFKKPGYTTHKVTRSDIAQVVSESGLINVNGKTDIYSPTNGVIEEVFVTNDQAVAEGDELFTVKSTSTEQEKQAAYSSYLTAKSNLDNANTTLLSLQAEMFSKWDVFRELAESDDYENSDGSPKYEQRALPEFHIPEKEWLAAEAKYKNQQNVITQAQAQLNSIWLVYQASKNATVKSPISGTITNLSVVPGTNVLINSPMAPTSPVLSIGNFTRMEVVLLVSEEDINKLKINQQAAIKVDAVDEITYEGLIGRTDKIGTEIKGVIRYKTYVQILNPDENLRSGMSADVDITTKEYKGVLTVPNSAIKPYQGGKAVRAPGKNKGDIVFIPVQLGIRGEKKTQILKGLSEGQIIITALSNEGVKKSGLFGF